MSPNDGEDDDGAVDVEPTPGPSDVNIVMRCALKGAVSRLQKCFDDEEDQYHETVSEYLNERDDEGRSPLDMAAILGRSDMVKELIGRGAEVNNNTTKGYTALHRAAAWGKVEVIKILVEHGSDLQIKTAHGERARETALRYNHTECVDYLDWAEAKTALEDTIRLMRETMQDPEKVQGRLAKEDRKVCDHALNEKTAWLDNSHEATTEDFIHHKQLLDELLAPIWQKLSEPPPE